MFSNVDGNHVLYHYLEKDLKEADIWLFQMLAARLFTALGVWFSPKVYASCPILLPFAVRDPNCRPRKKGDTDEWGAPDSMGRFRDDNSLVKGLPRSLAIRSPRNPIYHGRKLGNGFVACHVWRIKTGGGSELSSRDPDTYSFVPNLVWLPTQVAKLTDREGSFAQAYLQALSSKIYKRVEVPHQLSSLVERSWGKLPVPQGIPDNGLPDPQDLSYFEDNEAFIARRLEVIGTVRTAMENVVNQEPIRGKIVSSRYTTGLTKLLPENIAALQSVLHTFMAKRVGD
jgi:hypothetical protein